jgi:TP901 family phage tail tape measure protein
MSQKLGMSAEKYQEWDAIMQHSGSDVDKMGVSMKKLAEAVEKPTEKTAAAFEKLGISAEDAAKMSQEELFAKTIEALQGMESGTERAVIANDLLGKSAQDLGALLNTSAEDTEAMRKKVHELGGVMSNDAVKAAARYQDSLQDMKTAVGGIVNSIGTAFMPSISDMMDGFAALVTGNEEGIAQMEQGLDDFVKTLEDTVSNIAAAADKFLPVIINAIAKICRKSQIPH